jgi:hypothetical protein
MKHTIALFGLVFMLNVSAADKKNSQPTEAEIQQNRACFQDLEVQGCRTQEDDPEQFRECLSNAHESMDDHCKKLMLKLHGT